MPELLFTFAFSIFGGYLGGLCFLISWSGRNRDKLKTTRTSNAEERSLDDGIHPRCDAGKHLWIWTGASPTKVFNDWKCQNCQEISRTLVKDPD